VLEFIIIVLFVENEDTSYQFKIKNTEIKKNHFRF